MYKIITDGSCDLNSQYIKENDLINVPFSISFDDDGYKKEGLELGVEEFYQKMVDNPRVYPKTSTPSIGDYLEAMEPALKEGFDLLVICITSKFSGSYNAACNARDMLEHSYSNRIEVVDSRVNTVLQGLVVKQLVKMRDKGKSLDELLEYLDIYLGSGRIFFTIGSMDYLVAGGRVGKLSSIGAGLLSIKPIICLKDGEIYNDGLKRGRKKSLGAVIEKTISHFKDQDVNIADYDLVVGYGYDIEEANVFKEQLSEAIKNDFDCHIQEIGLERIGATIAVHTGPCPLGVGLIKKV